MITIVSGLPRSGTSLMMQMLCRGGMPLLYDNVRKPDASNTKGYFELEKVKSIEKDSSWLDQAEGKAVKIVAPLLHALPSKVRYKILFMERPLEEIIRSQRDMLALTGTYVDQKDDRSLAIAFRKQLRQIKDWLLLQKNMETCFVAYHKLIDKDTFEIRKINRFCGDTLDEAAMLEAIDAGMYKHRVQEQHT